MDPQNPYSPQQPSQPQYQPSFSQVNGTPPQQPMMQPHIPPQNTVSHHSKLGDKIEQVIMLSYFFVAALLVFRFALGMFGARQSPFVEFVRALSIPFMIPFEGMFGATPTVGYYSIEFEALVAIIVYAGVFFGLAQLVKILFK
jgi:hypothetical protein